MAERKSLHEWTDTGLMLGLGLLLVWDISTTNSNTNRISTVETEVSTNKSDHESEVKRSEKEDDELIQHLLALDERQRNIKQKVNDNAVDIKANTTAREYIHKGE